MSKSGTLFKKRGGFGGLSAERWQRRYFVLSADGDLKYYEQPSSEGAALGDARGTMRLGSRGTVQALKESLTLAPFPYGFEVKTEGEAWQIVAESAEDRDAWLQAIALIPSVTVQGSLQVRHGESKGAPHANGTGAGAASAGAAAAGAAVAAADPPVLRSRRGVIPKKKKKTKEVNSIPAAAKEAGKLAALLTMLTSLCVVIRMLSEQVFLRAVAALNAALAMMYAKQVFSAGKRAREKELAKKREQDRAALRRHRSSFSAAAGADGGGAAAAPASAYKAGSTFQEEPQNDPPGEDPLGDGRRFVHRWRRGIGTQFRVRQPNYASTKKKGLSQPALYECLAIDVIRSAYRRDNIASEIELPKSPWDITDTGDPDVPPYFIINVQLPDEAPSVFSSAGDGPTTCFAMWLAIRPEAVRALKGEGPMIPGLRCFQRWCRSAEQDPKWMTRFKAIGVIQNWDDVASAFGSLSGKIKSFNGKPVLIRKNTTLYRGDNYLEFDANVHKFSIVSRNLLWAVQEKLQDLCVNLAFLIESRDEDELPEAIVGCAQYCRLDLSAGVDLFGTYHD